MWHYLNMIQFCSRGKRYTGVMPLAHARTCSTVEDQMGALAALITAGLVENVDGATVRVVRIEEHVPPPSVRDAAAATKIRVARHRKHKNGDHRECSPEKCPHAGNGGSNALPQDRDRTGPDRTGREVKEVDLSEEDEMWEDYKRTWPETLAEDPG